MRHKPRGSTFTLVWRLPTLLAILNLKFGPYLILIRLWWRCLLWYMTYEICQPIIRHSSDKELFLYLLNKRWREVLITRISGIQKNGYYATSYIWGSRVLNLERSTSIEMYGSCSLESQWKLIVVLHMNSNRTLNRQQTLSFHQDVNKAWQFKVFAQYPNLKVKISLERSVSN